MMAVPLPGVRKLLVLCSAVLLLTPMAFAIRTDNGVSWSAPPAGTTPPILAGAIVPILTGNPFTDITAADLVIEEITWLPNTPLVGEKITFTISLRNQGTAPSPASEIACYLDDEHLTSVSINLLNPDTATTIVIPWKALPGPHVIKVVADSSQSVPESDETNNVKTFAFSVLAPDLVIVSINGTPEKASVGGGVTFTVTIQNKGSSTARASQVHFYLDGFSWGYAETPRIDAGANVTRTFSWFAKPGTHTVKAVVDFFEHIAESDETNNEKTSDYVTATPDLIINTITWTPANPLEGDNITITMYIQNQGEGKSPASRVAYYLDDSYFASAYVKPLNPAAQAAISFSWQTQHGLHTMKAVADGDQAIAESDETNNVKEVSLPSFAPDLIIQNIMWTPSHPLAAHHVVFTTTVKNQGRADAIRSRLYFYIGDNMYSLYVTELAPGATENLSISWIALKGNYLIKAVADAENYITESEEANNTRTAMFVSGPPAPSDLLVQAITWEPATPLAGESTTLTITIKNRGSGPSGYSETACIIDDNYLTSAQTDSIASGATAVLALSWIAQPGVHTITVIADATQNLDETDETNNTGTATISVPAPDLIIENMTWAPPNPEVGATVNLTVTVRNQGNYQAASSYLGYYVDDSSRGYHYIEDLAAGAAVTKTFSWTVPAGTHALKVVADAQKQVMELKENNNEKSLTFPVPQTGAPDSGTATENESRPMEAEKAKGKTAVAMLAPPAPPLTPQGDGTEQQLAPPPTIKPTEPAISTDGDRSPAKGITKSSPTVTPQNPAALPPRLHALLKKTLESWWPLLATILLGSAAMLTLLRIRSHRMKQSQE